MKCNETKVIEEVLEDLSELEIEYIESHGILYSDELICKCYNALKALLSNSPATKNEK